MEGIPADSSFFFFIMKENKKSSQIRVQDNMQINFKTLEVEFLATSDSAIAELRDFCSLIAEGSILYIGTDWYYDVCQGRVDSPFVYPLFKINEVFYSRTFDKLKVVLKGREYS